MNMTGRPTMRLGSIPVKATDAVMAAEDMIVLMALYQITRMVISTFIPGKSKNSIS